VCGVIGQNHVGGSGQQRQTVLICLGMNMYYEVPCIVWNPKVHSHVRRACYLSIPSHSVKSKLNCTNACYHSVPVLPFNAN